MQGLRDCQRMIDRWAAARAALPPDAIDLADAIDDPPSPVMPDWSHTNTAGARMIAAALLVATGVWLFVQTLGFF